MPPSSGVVWDTVVTLKRSSSAVVRFAAFDAYDVGIVLKAAGALLSVPLTGLALERVTARSDPAYRAYYGPLRMYYFAAADRVFVVDSNVVYRLEKGVEAALALYGAGTNGDVVGIFGHWWLTAGEKRMTELVSTPTPTLKPGAHYRTFCLILLRGSTVTPPIYAGRNLRRR